jgi:hypothetical protein
MFGVCQHSQQDGKKLCWLALASLGAQVGLVCLVLYNHTWFGMRHSSHIASSNAYEGCCVTFPSTHNFIAASLLIGGAACLGCANTASRTAQIVLASIGQFGCTGGSCVFGRVVLQCAKGITVAVLVSAQVDSWTAVALTNQAFLSAPVASRSRMSAITANRTAACAARANRPHVQ